MFRHAMLSPLIRWFFSRAATLLTGRHTDVTMRYATCRCARCCRAADDMRHATRHDDAAAMLIRE